MTDVVDSDELLRRIQRARTFAAEEARTWRTRGGDAGEQAAAGGGPPEAVVRTAAYEAVLEVLDEILRPGSHSGQG